MNVKSFRLSDDASFWSFNNKKVSVKGSKSASYKHVSIIDNSTLDD